MKLNVVNVMPVHPTCDLFGGDLLFACTPLDVLGTKTQSAIHLYCSAIWNFHVLFDLL